jgi:hypothetical protein
MDRLQLAGNFDVAGARFTSKVVQTRLADLSKRARGLDSDAHSEPVASDFRAQFRLNRSVLTLRDATFAIPGAVVQVGGTYGLATELLQFDGTVRMKATVSQAVGGGVKSVLLKVIDPLFKRGGAGAMIPIRIRGTRNDPKFSLDVGRTFKRQ